MWENIRGKIRTLILFSKHEEGILKIVMLKMVEGKGLEKDVKFLHISFNLVNINIKTLISYAYIM